MADEILEMRAAIVRKLREALPGVDVDEHPRAALDPRDIDACKQALTLRVSFAGTPEDAQMSADEVQTATAWAIYVITKDGGPDKLPRDVIALRVLPSILRTVASDHFCTDFAAEKPRMVRSKELYAGEAEASTRSAMVWGVSWTQLICIPPDESELEGLRPFLKLIVDYDLAPANEVIDATDTILLPQG